MELKWIIEKDAMLTRSMQPRVRAKVTVCSKSVMDVCYSCFYSFFHYFMYAFVTRAVFSTLIVSLSCAAARLFAFGLFVIGQIKMDAWKIFDI